MSKKFYAVNRETGERWKPNNKLGGPYDSVRQYLVLYDSGYCAVVTEEFYTSVTPLDPKVWKVIVKEN